MRFPRAALGVVALILEYVLNERACSCVDKHIAVEITEEAW
jgi:hypothetical protein